MAFETVKRVIRVSNDAELASLEGRILSLSKKATEQKHIDLIVMIADGAYRMECPITLDTETAPGLSYMNITFRAKRGASPVLHSLVDIESGFEPVSDRVYKCRLAPDGSGAYPVFRELYCEGKKLPIAKSESFIHPFGMPDKKDASNPENQRCLFAKENVAKKLIDYGDVSCAELTMFLEWEWCNAPIGSIDLNDVREHEGERYVRVTLKGELHNSFIKCRHSIIDIGGRQFHFTNHPAFLTPGTYSYNCESGELYYCLKDGEAIEEKSFAYPTLEQLIVLKGTSGVKLKGLTFTGAGSKHICKNMYFAAQSNADKTVGLLKHTAVLTKNVKDLTVDGCTFRDLGGNGILMTDSSIRVRIYASRFYRVSMSAIVIGNRTTAWERPENRNFDIEIINNRLDTVGYDYPAAGGIYISMVDGLRILHNTIERTAYSGITVGWGWSRVYYSLGEKVNIRDAEIAYNRIIDFMQLMRDGAAIYVLGANCRWEDSHRFNFMHDNYAEREMYIDHSKRGYYMDGSSTSWEVWDNVIIGVRLPVFSQFHVPEQFTHHNYVHDVYTDFPVDKGNHAPERDTIVENCFCVPEGKAALFEKYPKAKRIFAEAGSFIEK